MSQVPGTSSKTVGKPRLAESKFEPCVPEYIQEVPRNPAGINFASGGPEYVLEAPKNPVGSHFEPGGLN